MSGKVLPPTFSLFSFIKSDKNEKLAGDVPKAGISCIFVFFTILSLFSVKLLEPAAETEVTEDFEPEVDFSGEVDDFFP